MPKCNQIIDTHKRGQSIPALPKIKNLETYVSSFLSSGKLFLIQTYKLLQLFYNTPITDRNAAYFNTHNEWIRSELGHDHPIAELLTTDLAWIRLLSECRNAVEHPEKGQELFIKNISLKPGNKFSGPAWKYDLSKKNMPVQGHETDLIHDFNVFLDNMLSFFEELLILCLSDKMGKALQIFKRNEKDIDPECPIKYFISIKDEFRTNSNLDLTL